MEAPAFSCEAVTAALSCGVNNTGALSIGSPTAVVMEVKKRKHRSEFIMLLGNYAPHAEVRIPRTKD